VNDLDTYKANVALMAFDMAYTDARKMGWQPTRIVVGEAMYEAFMLALSTVTSMNGNIETVKLTDPTYCGVPVVVGPPGCPLIVFEH
jgi:hypothetical protein